MSTLILSPIALNEKSPLWIMPDDWKQPTAPTTTEPSCDEENVRLMMKVRDGDAKAFERLVELNQRAVIGTVARMLNNLDDAHDIAQQVFIRVWRSAARYEPSAKFTTWLFTITRNLVFNEMRRRTRKREVSIEAQMEEHHLDHAAPERSNPDIQAQQEELERAIDAAIQTLPEKQRMAVALRKFEDMPYEEICVVLGMSLSAVKSLLFRARNDLKEKLAAYLDEG